MDELSRTVDPLLTYEPVSSESPVHIFNSSIIEKIPQSQAPSNQQLAISKLNLCRPAGGLAVGLSHSVRRHLGILDKNDCVGYIGPLNSSFGMYYNILGPLLVGSQIFINEHSDSDFKSLKDSISKSKITSMILPSKTIRQ